MPELILFQFPGACSRVTMTALEEIGVEFADRVVNLRAGEQKEGDYLALNPKAKVPALTIDGVVMTENPAILAYLHQRYPEAGLLPSANDPVAAHQGIVDLIWLGGTIHPVVRQVRAPFKLTKGDPEDVRADGFEKFAREAKLFSARLADDRWWYGDTWSILDVYVYWAYDTAAKGGFPLKNYPELLAHAERVRSRPSFRRSLAREQRAAKFIRLNDEEASLL